MFLKVCPVFVALPLLTASPLLEVFVHTMPDKFAVVADNVAKVKAPLHEIELTFHANGELHGGSSCCFP